MKRLFVVGLIVASICAGAFSLYSATPQQQGNPQMSPSQMKEYMETMFKSMLQAFSSPEMAQAQAKYYRNLYDALVKNGFSKEEALQIVVSQGSPLRSGGR